MRTGLINDADTTADYVARKTVEMGVNVFMGVMQEAIKYAEIYCKHAGRCVVTAQDVRLGMIYVCVYFHQVGGLAQRIHENFTNGQFCDNDDDESDGSEEGSEEEEEESEGSEVLEESDGSEGSEESEAAEAEAAEAEEAFNPSRCGCVFCTNVHTALSGWSTYEPTEYVQQLLKKSIDNGQRAFEKK